MRKSWQNQQIRPKRWKRRLLKPVRLRKPLRHRQAVEGNPQHCRVAHPQGRLTLLHPVNMERASQR